MEGHSPQLQIPGTLSRSAVIPKFFITFLPLILMVLFGSLILYTIENSALEKIIGNQEIASLDNQGNLIKNDFNAIVSDLLYLAAQAGKNVKRDGQGIAVATDFATEFLEFTRYKGIYDQVRLIDLNGIEKIRVNNNMGRPRIVPLERLQFKGNRYYFTDTIRLAKGEVFVSPFDLNVENGRIEEPLKPVIRFGTPIYDSNGDHLGVIVLNYLGSKLNNKIREISNTVTGSNMLLNSEGHWIISPTRDDEWGFMYPNRKDDTFGKRYPEIWGQLSGKRRGQLYHSGHLYTFNTIRPLEQALKSSTGSSAVDTPSARPIGAEDYYWILLSHVDQRIFKNELRLFRTKLYFIDGILFVILGIGSWLVANARANRDQLLDEKQLLIDELQDALANIHTLRGFIPICSSCKNIRDDQGYWSRIESYIAERSEAEFSHSICPTCVEKLYPDLYKGYKGKKDK